MLGAVGPTLVRVGAGLSLLGRRVSAVRLADLTDSAASPSQAVANPAISINVSLDASTSASVQQIMDLIAPIINVATGVVAAASQRTPSTLAQPPPSSPALATPAVVATSNDHPTPPPPARPASLSPIDNPRLVTSSAVAASAEASLPAPTPTPTPGPPPALPANVPPPQLAALWGRTPAASPALAVANHANAAVANHANASAPRAPAGGAPADLMAVMGPMMQMLGPMLQGQTPSRVPGPNHLAASRAQAAPANPAAMMMQMMPMMQQMLGGLNGGGQSHANPLGGVMQMLGGLSVGDMLGSVLEVSDSPATAVLLQLLRHVSLPDVMAMAQGNWTPLQRLHPRFREAVRTALRDDSEADRSALAAGMAASLAALLTEDVVPQDTLRSSVQVQLLSEDCFRVHCAKLIALALSTELKYAASDVAPAPFADALKMIGTNMLGAWVHLMSRCFTDGLPSLERLLQNLLRAKLAGSGLDFVAPMLGGLVSGVVIKAYQTHSSQSALAGFDGPLGTIRISYEF
jgi:hypothetical protein